jgi:two-component system chemotaxis sensor kinase CheA
MSWEEARTLFGVETEELLHDMEEALLSLDDCPDDKELLNALFRAMHTIKGAAGIFGFDAIVAFTHPVESAVDQIRSGQRRLDKALIATLLACKDHTAALVAHVLGSHEPLPEALATAGQQIVAAVSAAQPAAGKTAPGSSGPAVAGTPAASAQKVAGQPPTQEVAASPAATNAKTDKIPADAATPGAADQWLIALDFHADALRHGLDPLSFIHYLQTLGTITNILTTPQQMPAFAEADFESCYLSFRIAFHSAASKAAIEAVFEFALDDCRIKILPSQAKVSDYLQTLDNLPDDASHKLGEMLIEIGAITARELAQSLQAQAQPHPQTGETRRLGEVLVEEQLAEAPLVEQVLKKQQQAREQSLLIRVDAAKLGQLINLVGELVISTAAIKNLVEKHHLHEADEIVSGVEHLVEEIRDHALQLRMVQIGETFARFRRVTRDVSLELGKSIELVVQGGESELDKSVVEKIADPLTHLVRNALDHGIELPAERRAKGKPETGTLTLNAYHESDHIVIEVTDDGAGLDPERIRRKAEAIGLVEPGQVLSRQDILRLIFEPGLTTKEQTSNLSGRGVGMDVVRRNIEALRGTVELDSEPGVGTRVTIQLPLTLAIIDGFMVGAGNENYVIPLSTVEECVEMQQEAWAEDSHRHYVNLRGEVMPYLRLTDFFAVPAGSAGKRESLVVVRCGRHKAGFVVDTLYGEQQTVIRPLSKIFQHLKGISGATVLGSGEMALILDVQGLVNIAGARSKTRAPHASPNLLTH